MREKILEILEKNAKVDVHEIAVRLGVNEVDVANELADMEKEKVICGYHTLINWDNTSKEKGTALIEVKVTPQRGLGFDSIAERIYNYEEITAVYLMSGGFDFTVIIAGQSMKTVAQFVDNKLAPLEAVLSTSTHFILKKYKDHKTVIEDVQKDERILVTP